MQLRIAVMAAAAVIVATYYSYGSYVLQLWQLLQLW